MSVAMKHIVWKLAAAVGVPVIAPVFAFSVRPAGSVPAETLYVYGAVPPEAVRH